MVIVASAWIYVVLMMSIVETSIVAGIMTFLFYCALPLGLILYVMNTPSRRRHMAEKESARLTQNEIKNPDDLSPDKE